MSATSVAMEAIKKKLSSMRQEKESAIDIADSEEAKCKEIEQKLSVIVEENNEMIKRFGIMENEIATATLQLQDLENQLEIENNKATDMEDKLANFQKELRECEADVENTEEKFVHKTEKLQEASTAADEGDRGCKALEQRKIQDVDRKNLLEIQLSDLQYRAQAADDKYAEVTSKMQILDIDLDVSERSACEAEARLSELEEELLVVGNNVRSLEVSNEKRAGVEYAADDQIKELNTKLQAAERRVQSAESNTLKLQSEIDRMEDDISREREIYKVISEELEVTMIELSGY